MSHAYTESDETIVHSYRRIHANGEQTHVHILSTGDRYTVVAADVDPREFVPVAGETIGYEPTVESAQERAQAWMEANSKGIAESDGKGNVIVRLLKKLNDYGNDLQQTQTEDNDA